MPAATANATETSGWYGGRTRVLVTSVAARTLGIAVAPPPTRSAIGGSSLRAGGESRCNSPWESMGQIISRRLGQQSRAAEHLKRRIQRIKHVGLVMSGWAA